MSDKTKLPKVEIYQVINIKDVDPSKLPKLLSEYNGKQVLITHSKIPGEYINGLFQVDEKDTEFYYLKSKSRDVIITSRDEINKLEGFMVNTTKDVKKNWWA